MKPGRLNNVDSSEPLKCLTTIWFILGRQLWPFQLGADTDNNSSTASKTYPNSMILINIINIINGSYIDTDI